MRIAILLLLILAGCTSRVPNHTVRVYAAASMTDVVTDAAAAFTLGPVSTSFSATSELARQIEDGAPAGRYTRGALDALGLLAHFNPLLVGQKDVRAALRAVEAGEVDAGFVYATDAQASGKVKVLFTFDTATHPQIEYCAAVVNGGNVEGGRAFVDFLLGEQGRELLKAKGFVLPSTD